MKYRAEISGLRAIAVLPVVFFHAGSIFFSGGYLGVDVFFVISGFLIGFLLVDEIQKGKLDLIQFYEHRARRIFPAFFAVMLLCSPFAWLLMNSKEVNDFSNSLLAAVFFVSNFYFWKSSDYFSESLDEYPLLHTWSLSVEEQFYLLFPLLLLISFGFFKKRFFYFFVVLFFLSLILSEVFLYFDPVVGFYLLPTRAWELLSGVLAAIYVHKNGQPSNNKLAALGLFLILYAIFIYDKSTPTPGFFTVIPVAGAVLIIIYADAKTIVGKILGYRPLAGIGLISYSIYLIHQPVMAFSRIAFGNLDSWMMYLLSLLSILLAWPCWKYVEQPFRYRSEPGFYRFKLASRTLACVVVLVVIGLMGIYSHKSQPGNTPKNQLYVAPEFPSRENGYCFYSLSDISLGLKVGKEGINCIINSSGRGPKGLIIGDSFAAQYEPLWKIVASDLDLSIRSVTTNSCFPALDVSFKINASGKAYQQCLYNRDYFRRNIDDYDFFIIGAAWGDYLKYGFEKEVVDILNFAIKKDKQVIIMAAPRYYKVNFLSLYNRSVENNEIIDREGDYVSGLDKDMIRANFILNKLSSVSDNIVFVDRKTLFSSDGEFESNWTDKDLPFAYDKRHISIIGAKAAATNLMNSEKYQELSSVLFR